VAEGECPYWPFESGHCPKWDILFRIPNRNNRVCAANREEFTTIAKKGDLEKIRILYDDGNNDTRNRKPKSGEKEVTVLVDTIHVLGRTV